MKTAKCDAFIERFLALDKDEPMDAAMKIHALMCRDCRDFIRLYAKTEKLCTEPLQAVLPQNDPALALIIKKIAPMASQKTEERVELISLKRWIVSGFILVFAVFLFGVFSTIDGSSKLHMLLFLCFALFISGYCAFFIGSNLNFFIKRLGV